MTCIHGLSSSVVYYVISNIHVSNQIETFDLLNDHELNFDIANFHLSNDQNDHVLNFDIANFHLSNDQNDHEPNYDHRNLNLTLNFAMHMSIIEENSNNQRKLPFGKSKDDIFLKDLNSELDLLTYKDNIEDLYQNFTTTLSTSINMFSFDVSCKNNNMLLISP